MSSDSVGLLDLQDTCFYTGDLFSKYLLPDCLKTKINQMLAVNETVYSQERAEWLKEALIPDHSISIHFTSTFDLEPKELEFFESMSKRKPLDAEQLGQNISSLGVLSAYPNALDAFTIQTCHILIEMFLNHLKNQGRASFVETFRSNTV